MTVYQNKLYVGGVLWLDLKGIGGWDGQKWDSLNGGVEPGSVNDLQIFQDTLYVGGNFDSAGSIRTPNIAKWDGQQWHPVDSFQYNVSQLTVYENQLYANSGDSIYRLESGGWNAIAGPSRLTGVRLEALDTFDNKLFVGGLFDTVDNNKVTNIGYYQNGDWHGFEPYPDFEVSAMTGYQNRLVIGGAFDSIGSLEAYRIAQLNLFVGRMAKKKTDYNVKVYPNPFQNQAKIEIPIDTIPGENPEEARVRLIFYDMIGRQVIPKYSVIRECHQLTLKIGGENLNSGLYLYQLKIREQLLKTGKIISQ